jgi:type IV pilus assembly protein PilY1
MSQSRFLQQPLRHTARAAQLLLACPLMMPVGSAGAITLADEPLGTGVTSVTVKPNVAMVLDDSGSMAWTYMPNGGNSSTLCYGNKLYNTLAYDPTYTYKPPYKPNGSVPAGDPYKDNKPRYPMSSFTSAKPSGFGTASSVNLSSNSNKPFSYGSRPATGYYYSNRTKNLSTGTTCPSNNPNSSYAAVTSSANIAAPGVSNGSAAALQNYANWYSYYRTRINMMKSATGEAFSTVSDNYRVGLFYLHQANTPVKIADFDTTQRQTWYNTLYSTTVDNGTPLRRALSNMGRMYAGKEKTKFGDPVQYSCQQNFTILSTDGYWNGDGSLDLSGNPIKDQDGGALRPYLDVNKQSDTLADTAYYYYQTDLRTSALNNCQNTIGGVTYANLCENNVPGSGKDKNEQQHMTTFTLGLGVNGTVTYESGYESAPDIKSVTQYIDILNGTANWAKIVDWDCQNNCPPQIDDLWHAAVNGRGTYFSASNPSSVEAGLREALAGVSARLGTGAAVATSNLELVAGSNAVYLAQYRTGVWDGELIALAIDPMSGAINTTTPLWFAQSALDKQVVPLTNKGDGRNIFFYSSSTQQLESFTFANLSTDGKGALFTNACPVSGASLTQCATLDATQKTEANKGDNLVNYLRGQDTYEADTNASNPLFREREHLLGDIANAMPVFVEKPQFAYEQYDLSYAGFKSDQATRAGTVYAAANDGMLHAINAGDGTERWAYVPSFVMPNMRLLADTNYQHRYFVDGSPTVADVCSSPSGGSTSPSVCNAKANWHTVLIGGLDKGGCGYYALDITDPNQPKALWEFTHANLGYSFSDPIVTRRSDGKWVAIFSSGYQNVPGTCGKPGGDGRGHVFVVDAMTGALLDTISTSEGTSASPSNLGRLNAWVDDAALNTADAIYGADMQGNVWRFDFDNKFGPSGTEAFKLATLFNGSGTAQPVTNKVELAEIKNHRVVFVGTGSLLNTNDLLNTEIQSIYALVDDTTAATGLGNPRTNSMIKARNLISGTNQAGNSIRTVSGVAMDWSTDKGWYIDLSAGERVNVDMQLQHNMLNVASNVPESNACTAGGYSWLYFIDFETGKNFTTASDNMLGLRLPNNALTAGIKMVKTQSGKTVTIISDTLGKVQSTETPSTNGGGTTTTRRTMWREIQD